MPDAVNTKPATRNYLYLVPIVLVGLIYLPTLYDLVGTWINDSNYSHGFLIPFISFYLIWSQRKELPAASSSGELSGLVLIIVGLAMFVVGNAAAEYFTARLSLVILLFGLTWYLFGNQMARKTWFACFFLVFMIPVPYVIYYAIAFPLQLTATKITVGLLSQIGMSVVRQGNIIHLAGGHSLEVAEACSGIRSLVALMALGAIYAQWSQKTFLAKTVLFLSTIPIAIVANVIRVMVTTILVATVTPEVTAEPMHTIMGLFVFAIAYVGFFITSAILKRIFR